MANYSNLLATIAANIYTNNNNEVTAAGVQAAVNAMVAAMGAGYQFMGVAQPSDTPSGYADLRAFWLAGEVGTYTNFGGIAVADGEIAVIKYDGDGWSKEVLPGGDNLPLVDIEDADLEFWDENRNVLVRFANGHIQTKNFNSANGGGGNSGSLKILFFGNSLTQDAVSYLPLLLEEIAPNLDFTLYIFYNGGLTLTNQYNSYILQPNTNCGIFSEYHKGDGAWTNYSNSKSINWVIANCDFDILCLQEYGNSGQSDAIITTAFTNITDWFFNNYSKALRVVSLCDAPARLDVAGVTTRIEHYNEVFMESCCSQGIIPAGLAITYACDDPGLDALGDSGHLSPDGVHAQEGLPCLLQSYVVAMWIFDLLGMPLSIWGSKTRITTAIYTALNVPGANLGTGVVEGTEANHLAAQKCAVKAYKRGLYLVNTAVANLT